MSRQRLLVLLAISIFLAVPRAGFAKEIIRALVVYTHSAAESIESEVAYAIVQYDVETHAIQRSLLGV